MRILGIITLLIGISPFVFGQENQKATKVPTKSFIDRENLTRYYRAAVNSNFFSEDDGELTFDASLFGIKKIFNPDLDVDTAFTKKANRISRRLQLGFSLSRGEESKIESFSPEIKFALIDKRDFQKGHKDEFFAETLELGTEIGRISAGFIAEYASRENINMDAFNDAYKEYQKAQEDGNPSFDIFPEDFKNGLNERFENDPTLKEIKDRIRKEFDLKNEIEINASNFNETIESTWKNEGEIVSRRGLWTIQAGWTHSNRAINALSFESKYVVGLNQNKPASTPANLEIFSTYSFDNDSIMEETNIEERQIFKIGANFGKVLLEDKKENSLLELKAGISLENILKGVREDEDNSDFNFNVVLTPRISEDLYIPIELKYDPDENNFLGFLSLEWNFNANDK